MNNKDFNSIDKCMPLLEKLCLANGASSDEEAVMDIILNEIKDYIDDYKIDNLKNLIVYKKGKKRPKSTVMVSAHMDEVGFIITSITDSGFLKFSSVGGINNSVICGKHVTVGKNKIPGVIGIKPIHMLKPEEKGKPVPIEDMYIDIGAKDKDDAMKYISLGDFAYFKAEFYESDGIIRTKAIDDRAGCLILINMIKSELEYDTVFSFVTQEEIGLRGAKTASYTINPDIAIVIEATTASDLADTADHEKVCCINKGAVISFMDKRTIYDRELYKMAINSSKYTNVLVQEKRAVAGGNDAGAIQVSRNGVRTIAISIPARYLHCAAAMISKYDLYAVEKTAMYMLENINK